MFSFLVRKPGMSFEDFKSYYENTHAPMALHSKNFTGPHAPLSYNRHYVDRKDGSGACFPFGNGQNWGFDCITRVEFKDEETFKKGMKNFAENSHEIQADEDNFLDRSKSIYIIVGECPCYVLTGIA